ncbi:hypothetical protein F4803DRAFT_533075 [Xylaria telfairii]|nr:hypothetical protein F4803DRAFT_533075 [Xylaria telfairii]
MDWMGDSKWLEWDYQLHPALADHHELDFFIHKALFDSIFCDERFTEWQSSSNNWQLRFTGSPGCGKTTLSALVVEKLRNKGKAVACLFLQDDVTSEGGFAEDFLHSILTQFSREISPSESHSDEYMVEYQKYLEACRLQQRGSYRMNLIRKALHAVVSKLQQAFLIVDDIDRCSPATLMFVEEELAYLQKQRIKIMATSRVPWVDEPWKFTYCDGDNCQIKSPGRLIHVYWACEDCCKDPDEEMGITAFCNSCWTGNPGCTRCNNYIRFSQPYEHVNFNISDMGGMRNFVEHAIEQEHGYVGLRGSNLKDKLPTSNFGKQLLQSGKADTVVTKIVQCAHGNVALAHKRLELLHRDQSLKAFFATRDRLPAAIVDMFDAGLRCVEAQAINEHTLGLHAIAVVGLDQDGITFEKFKHLTQLSARVRGIDRKYISYRSLDDVLHATKGLVVRVNQPLHGPLLKAFHPDFFLYCQEHYNPSIAWASNFLGESQNSLSGAKRAQTFSPGGTGNSRAKGATNSREVMKKLMPEKLPSLQEIEGGNTIASSGFGFHRSSTLQDGSLNRGNI